MLVKVAFIDWAIIGAFLVGFLALAIYINSRCRSVADYLVSARKVRMWLGIGAGIAGEIGLVSIAAMCQQGYLHGFSFTLIIILSTVITLPLFGIFGFGIERFRASKAMSVPQYLEMRYSRRLRVITGITNTVAGVLQMCIFPIVGASFLQVLIDAPETVRLLGGEVQTTWVIMALLLLCNIVFTYFGGYVTLTVSNFFMMILIMGLMTWLLGHVLSVVGLQNMWSKLEAAHGRAAFYAFDSGSYGVTWFLWLMAMTILLQFSYGPYLQKYASMDKPKTVSRSYLLGSIFGNGRTFLIMAFGVAALAVYGTSVPAGMDQAVWSQQATAQFLSDNVPPVGMGFLLACLLFADISTTDQYLLSWGTSVVNDCVMPFRKKPFSPRRHVLAVRLTMVAMCGLFFVVGIYYVPTLPIWELLWLLANIIAGTGIAVLFGMYWPRANVYGAYAAVAANVVLPLADLIARIAYKVNGWEFPLAPEVTGLSAYVIGIVLIVAVSLLTRAPSKYWDLGKVVREMNAAEQSTMKAGDGGDAIPPPVPVAVKEAMG
jgi:solute:Na+ symporter, SSS family